MFRVRHASGGARTGVLTTAHGDVRTPAFMPVGTCGSVKGLWPGELLEAGADIVLANAYHLHVRPGHGTVAALGGLHGFMGWDRPVLTDSGGFQVFSLAAGSRVSDEGVLFRSHVDGSPVRMTPELSMEVQRALGSDVAMCFDDCPALPSPGGVLRASVERTLSWAARCRAAHGGGAGGGGGRLLFGIVQGGTDPALRAECLERLVGTGFDGYAVGGLSVGEKTGETRELLEGLVPGMPAGSPRYLMGVGAPLDVLHGVGTGLDLFDCVLPTRNGRNGQLFTAKGPLNVRNGRFKDDPLPPDPGCACRTCSRHSRAYLRHLFLAGEPLAGRMATLHNLHFYLGMMRASRDAIDRGAFDSFREGFYKEYASDEWR